MARELTFKLAGSDYSAAPVKLERKKIYGWTSIVATDRAGDVCNSVYLSPDDSLIIPSGGLKQATVDSNGRWVEKSELTPKPRPRSSSTTTGRVSISWRTPTWRKPWATTSTASSFPIAAAPTSMTAT